MIVRHGQLVHFWGDIDERLEVKSVTKSMGGIVLGLALDENKVALDDKGVTYMPTFGTPPAGNATKAQTITLAQLATHTSGFEKEDGELRALRPHQVTPGTAWTYSDAGLNWLADVLTTVYQQDLRALAQRSVCGRAGPEQRRHEYRRRPLAHQCSASAHARRRHSAVPRARVRHQCQRECDGARRPAVPAQGHWNGTRVLTRRVRRRGANAAAGERQPAAGARPPSRKLSRTRRPTTACCGGRTSPEPCPTCRRMRSGRGVWAKR